MRAIFLAIILLTAGCAESTEPGGPEAPSSSSAPVETPSPGYAPTAEDDAAEDLYARVKPFTGDLDGMAQRNRVRMLTVYSVGRYYLDGAQESGLVHEAGRQFEEFLNERFERGKRRLHVVAIPVSRDRLIPALLEGMGDIVVASLTTTEERRDQIDFSIPASRPLNEILITGPAAPELETIDDLAGQTLYVRRSSSYRESIEALNERLRSEGKDPAAVELVSESLEDEDLVEMVNAGLLPWTIVDDYKLAWWEEVFPEITPRTDIVFRSGAQMAWGMRKNSPQLQAAVNDFLRTHREGTLFGNVLKNRYIRDFDWADKATGAQALERHAELKPFFAKYGEQFGFDPLLLTAQGYQESRLDQSARSRYGAIGVMQIKRSTAADSNVGVEGIENVEANIHAGAKYLAFLRDRYFGDAAITPFDRTLLALAAYNMGPARMTKLRQQARAMGYDPNIWFDNVELAAARYVGREPVTYVANIYKYYSAYTWNTAQLERQHAARERAGIGAP